MKNLFDTTTALAIKERLERLTPDSRRQWGTLAAAQAMTHCSLGLEMGLGDQHPPRMMAGRLLGPIVKPMVFANDQPFRRNAPTMPSLLVEGSGVLEVEKARLSATLDRFVEVGPQGCTSHPHAFFGPLSGAEWAVLMYKHVDHHLRQFGV